MRPKSNRRCFFVSSLCWRMAPFVDRLIPYVLTIEKPKTPQNHRRNTMKCLKTTNTHNKTPQKPLRQPPLNHPKSPKITTIYQLHTKNSAMSVLCPALKVLSDPCALAPSPGKKSPSAVSSWHLKRHRMSRIPGEDPFSSVGTQPGVEPSSNEAKIIQAQVLCFEAPSFLEVVPQILVNGTQVHQVPKKKSKRKRGSTK